MRKTKFFSLALLAVAWLAGGTVFAQLDAEKVYTIVNNNDANMFMQDNGTGGVALDNKNDNSYWKFVPTANTDCYYIQNATTGKYIQGYTSSEEEVATGDTGVEYYVKADASGSYAGKYRMSYTANTPHDFSAGTLGLNWKTNGDVHTVQSFASVAEATSPHHPPITDHRLQGSRRTSVQSKLMSPSYLPNRAEKRVRFPEHSSGKASGYCECLLLCPISQVSLNSRIPGLSDSHPL